MRPSLLAKDDQILLKPSFSLTPQQYQSEFLLSSSLDRQAEKESRPKTARRGVPARLLYQLPLWGTVASWNEERGFGFLKYGTEEEVVFFHISVRQPHAPRQPRQDFTPNQYGYVSTLKDGEAILFILGADPRNTDALRAVRWTRVSDLQWDADKPPHDQESLDALRKEVLAGLELDELWRLLHADWYVKQWRNVPAPAVLKDGVLSTIWSTRIASMSPEALIADSARTKLSQSCYSFTAELSTGGGLSAIPLPQQAALVTPRAAWMDVASIERKQQLAHWYLLSEGGQVETEWLPWFVGSEAYEPELAGIWMDQELPPTDAIKVWIRQLIVKNMLLPAQVGQWVRDDSVEAALLFQYLPEHLRQHFLTVWKQYSFELTAALDASPALAGQVLKRGTLAIDLETDGKNIWELGCAQGDEPFLLYDQKAGDAGDIASAMAALAQRISSTTLLVGHNLLAWDWPILSQYDMPPPPLMWDTLLVQYLLEPQARSHALGSNHQAHTDSLAALQLFEQQLKRLPEAFACSLLRGEFQDAAQLLKAIAQALGSSVVYARAQPDWIKLPAISNADTINYVDAVLLLPAHRLRELDWVPGATVVPAHPQENLPVGWLQLDVNALVLTLQGTHYGNNFDYVATQVLLAVAQRAAAQGIALRRNMIAPWLVEGNASLKAALDAALFLVDVLPADRTQTLRLAPLPSDMAPLLAAGTEAFRLLGFNADVLVFDRQAEASIPVAVSGTAQNYRNSPLLRAGLSTGEQLWLQPDRAASMLSIRGGWQSFRMVALSKGQVIALPVSNAATQRAVLATRRVPALFPGALDQAGYWTEVIRTFREVAQRCANGAVPILLVGSTRSPQLLEMLQIALAEIQWGEARPEHRSQREHLLRAAYKHWAVVDALDCWPQWQARAESAGVTLLPVVEALPLEQWYAAWHMRSTQDPIGKAADISPADVTLLDVLERVPGGDAGGNALADEDEDDVEGDIDADGVGGHQSDDANLVETQTVVPSSAVMTVGASDLLKELSALLVQNLTAWLDETGLGYAERAAVLIDTRAAAVGVNMAARAELMLLHGHPLSVREADCLKQCFESLEIEREEAPSDYASMEQFLVKNWQPPQGSGGHPVLGFKDSQKVAMQAICSRQNDVLVTLPTGEGKSVLFQVPALCRGLRTRRLTLVISPLKALMRDQVEGLRRQGFAESADYLSSDRPAHEITEVIQGILDHRIVLLYVAPERLRSELFVEVLRKRATSDGGLEYAVVDETHCVNQWGHEFRPDYFHALDLLLTEFRAVDGVEHTPFVLLSATVTASDKQGLKRILQAARMPDQTGLPLVVLPEVFAHPLRAHIQVQPHRVQGLMSDSKAFDQMFEERLPSITNAIHQAERNQQKTGQRSAVIVFVSQRIQAEQVAQRLAEECVSQVDYFHAGLDALTREKVYERFREGDLTVLVATKAFGMGMDIPDIHWVIHLSPPAFLEDYLQEVGRIGRGVAQREKAQLENLSAGLLYSAADFEGIRIQRAQGNLQLALIKSQYEQIVAKAQIIEAQSMAIVPHDGFRPDPRPAVRRSKATQLRMSLYWLERAGRVKLRGSLPNLLEVVLHPEQLQRIAAAGGILGGAAHVILSMDTIEQAAQTESETNLLTPSSGWLARALGLIGDMAGLLLNSSPKLSSTVSSSVPLQASGAVSPEGAALINLSQIMLRCSFKSLSEVMACLADLAQRGGLTLEKNYPFAARGLAYEPKRQIQCLFDAVEAAGQQLLQKTSVNGVFRFSLDDLSVGNVVLTADPKKASLYQKSFHWGVLRLARMSGVRVRQLVDKKQGLHWEARIASSLMRQADARIKKTFAIARAVFTLLNQKIDLNAQQTKATGNANTESNVSLRELIETTRNAVQDKQFREFDLQKALSLLAAMNLVSLSSNLLPMSYVLTLEKRDGTLDEHQELWDELEQVNRLAKLRNDAMDVFANLPGEAQSSFVEGYFLQADADSMEKFIDAQLGDIEEQSGEDGNQGLSLFIREKREQLRATEVAEFFNRYRNPNAEEPNQWLAISHPYDQHLLVNAGPGAGKTSVLVGRVMHLIREQNIKPAEIIVLAFNRAVVFEIKKRLQVLFRTLGYAAYVKRLRVFTFHSFAMRSFTLAEGGLNELPDREGLLDTFAARLATDASFRLQVAGGCRSILVDEFQDVTHPIYQIVRQLYKGSDSSAGVMVIGDDDQDILRWQRKKDIVARKGERHEFSEKYFEQFKAEFGGEALTSLLLTVNFRSGTKIIDVSQKIISGFLAKNGQSHRLKTLPLRAQIAPPTNAQSKKIDVRGHSWQQAVDQVVQLCERHNQDGGGSLAILCRSNAEVADVHRQLIKVLPELVVQGGANFRVAELRHVGLWIELLEVERQQQNQVLTDGLQEELLVSFRQKFDVPEANGYTANDVRLEDLWALCCAEQAFPHLSDLHSFIKDLQTDELVRLLGASHSRTQAVVSTIHKVKGLEFDSVMMLPSNQKFSEASASEISLERDGAEETRLFYVGMTRAKHRLTYFLGQREFAWSQFPPIYFQGQVRDGLTLVGSYEEVSLGWPMNSSPFNPNPEACQDYIEKMVAVGDVIVLGGRGGGAFKELMHCCVNGRPQKIGFLSKQSDVGSPNASLKVSAVVRFRADVDANDVPLSTLAPSVQQRGWGYVVLVSGRLR